VSWSPASRKKSERKLDSYFPIVKPHTATTEVIVAAAPEVEKIDLPVVESNLEPILNHGQVENYSRKESFLVPKEKVMEGNQITQQRLLLPSFEDEDFDFDLAPAQAHCSVQRNVGDILIKNEILTLDD
jgi:hypothetical protein